MIAGSGGIEIAMEMKLEIPTRLAIIHYF